MSICFDLRFPQQYRVLSKRGAEWLFVPSAFTKETGRVHWHTLLRARAIENLATVFAPAQTGNHLGNRKTYGHSLVVGPWGDVLLDGGTGKGLKLVDVSVRQSKDFRRRFPSFIEG
jgi:predicted amidohydrolase